MPDPSKLSATAPPLERPASVSRFWFNVLAGIAGLLFLAWRQSVAPTAHYDNGL